MNKKIIIFIGIVLLLTASVSFAAILDGYGTITGTAEVSPLEFYIGQANDQAETLLINEKVSYCAPFWIKNVYRTFRTKDLGGVDFNYTPEVSFSVRAKVATTTPQDLILSWGYYDTTDTNDLHYLCTTTISLTESMENYTPESVECSGEKPKNVKRFFYEFKEVCEGGEECEGIEYMISKCAGGFYTKIKLNK